MNILLVYPPFLEARTQPEDIEALPIGIYYVAAMLKSRGFNVRVVDWHRSPMQEIEAQLRSLRPDVIGFSILHANRWGGIRIAQTAKRLHPDVRIVMGGVGATFLWELLLQHFPEIDYMVLGEGEKHFLELIQALARGDEKQIGRIGGLALRDNGRPVCTPSPEPIGDLDTLAMPAKYYTFQHISLTRGCPGRCTFCSSPRLWGRRVRAHSAAYFVESLERLHRKGVGFFYFSDDTFTFYEDLALDVCEGILRKGLDIHWAAISKVGLVSEPLLRSMRRAGCVQISYGVESGSSAVRKTLRKDIGEKTIRKAFDLTRRVGILPRAYFIYGCPGETDDTIGASIELMDRIQPLGAIFYVLDIFPGTTLYEDMKQRLGVDDGIWLKPIEDILYVDTDDHLTRDMVLDYGRRLRGHFYSRLPEYIRSIELIDDAELQPLHADFLSRLGLTLTHGDYAAHPDIPDKPETARYLFEKALKYAPDARAYLGLGMDLQRNRDFRGSVELLEEAVTHFPSDEQLHLCLGISRMNLGDYGRALDHFRRFPDSLPAVQYAVECCQALGDDEACRRFRERRRILQNKEA